MSAVIATARLGLHCAAPSKRYARAMFRLGLCADRAGGLSVDRDEGQNAASSQAPAPRTLDQRIVRSMLWLVVIVVAIPLVGFAVLIGAWLLLNPRW